MNTLLSDPLFWSKVAQADLSAPIGEQDCLEMLDGFLDHMKQAGADPFAVYGLILEAGAMADPSLEKTGGAAEWLGRLAGDPGGAMSNVGHQIVSGVSGLLPTGMTTGMTTGVQKMVQSGKNDFERGFVGAKMEKSPWNPLAKGFFNGDQDKANNLAMAIHKGDWTSVASQAWDGVKNNNMVKAVAPYAIPALATFAGAKLLGAGTGTALAAGAGVGGLVGGMNQFGGLDGLKHRLFPSTAAVKPFTNGGILPSPQEKMRQQTASHAAAVGSKVTGVPGLLPGQQASNDRMTNKFAPNAPAQPQFLKFDSARPDGTSAPQEQWADGAPKPTGANWWDRLPVPGFERGPEMPHGLLM